MILNYLKAHWLSVVILLAVTIAAAVLSYFYLNRQWILITILTAICTVSKFVSDYAKFRRIEQQQQENSEQDDSAK